MKRLITLSIGMIFAAFLFGCDSSDRNARENANNANSPATKSSPHKTPENTKSPKIVDVPKLANRSATEFDVIFGKPLKITSIKDRPKFMPGEYREYKVEGHPKNLSVRFYKNKAKRFNLLLRKPEKSSKAALKDIFKIEVSGMRRIKSDKLSETWEGKSDGIHYKTAYSKRSKSGGDFVMLHAEIR